MYIKRRIEIIVALGVIFYLAGGCIAGDTSGKQPTISRVVDKLLKQDPNTLTETQRNALGEGLYFLYCNNMSYEKYVSTRQVLSGILKKIDTNQKAGERLLILASRLGVDNTEIAKHSAPYKDKNLFFILSEIDALGRAGLVVEARKLALNTTTQEFSFAEPLGMQALLESLKKFKVTEPAKEIILSDTLGDTHLQLIHINDLFDAITRVYKNIWCTGDEKFDFLKLKFQVVQSLLKQRQVHFSMMLVRSQGPALVEELNKNNPTGAGSDLTRKYEGLLKLMMKLKDDVKFAEEISRKTLYYDYRKFSESECEQIIKKGLIEFVEKNSKAPAHNGHRVPASAPALPDIPKSERRRSRGR